MKRMTSILLIAITLIFSASCSKGINIPEGMGYYEYDTTPNEETGWDVEHLYSIGLAGLRKPADAALLSIDGEYTSDLVLFLVSNDGVNDVAQALYENMSKEITDLVKRDNEFISIEEGDDTENKSKFCEVCYRYNGKYYAAYLAYYLREEKDDEVFPACIGLSVTAYNKATPDSPQSK